ncbi:MAG: hypothetical protein COB93_06385 [Sneathiella sp.]|nr:MAG: hypothetical protein COB93_06385 [Sneathiella sp.]
MFRLPLFFALFVICTLILQPSPTYAAAEVGTVTRQQASATVVRKGQSRPLQVGAAIYEDDEVGTPKDGRLEVTFIDGTKLTIGENSRLLIDEFLYDPDKSIGTAVLEAIKGPFRFISGNIGKMANKHVEARTTFGTVGIRGTDFWGGPALGVYGILLLDGVIVVRNNAGGRILNVSGTGVNLTGNDVPPGVVAPWGQKRVDAALASISFK